VSAMRGYLPRQHRAKLLRWLFSLVWLVWFLPATTHAEGPPRTIHVAPPQPGLPAATAAGCGSESFPCTSLQTAADLAEPGDTVLLAAGVYTADGPAVLSLTDDKPVTLIGGFDPITWMEGDNTSSPTIIDGEGVRRGIYIANTYNLMTFENLIIRNGRASDRIGAWGAMGGGMLCLQNASVLLQDVTFSNNQVWAPDTEAVGGGGAAFLWGGPGAPCPVTMENVTFDANEVHAGSTDDAPRGGHGLGGGFFVTHSDLTATNLILTNNRVWGGNGGAGGEDSHLGRADALGGGAAVQYSNATIDNVLASDNHTVAGNGADFGGSGAGGGLFLELGVGTIISATLANNTVTGGDSPEGTGGIGAGGGLMTERQILTLDRTRVISNASFGGNGINSGHAGGGGIYLTQPRGSDPAPNHLTATNIVVAGNRTEAGTGVARWGGGGAIFSQNTELTLYFATVADNSILPTMSGSGIVVLHDAGVGTSRADIVNTVIAGHVGVDSAIDAVLSQDVGTVVNLRRTLFYNNTRNTGSRYGAVIHEVDSIVGDPAFTAAGVPAYDYHLSGVSAAVNRAQAGLSDHDADGHPRPQAGRSEIGAYELAQPITMSAGTVPGYVWAADGPTHTVAQWVQLRNSSSQGISVTVTVDLPQAVSPVDIALWQGLQVVAGGDSGGGAAVWTGVVPASADVRLSYTYGLTVPTTFTPTMTLVSRANLAYQDELSQSFLDGIDIPVMLNMVPVMLPVVLN